MPFPWLILIYKSKYCHVIMKNILSKILLGLKFMVLTHVGRIITLMALSTIFDYLSHVVKNDSTGHVFYIAFLVCIGALLIYALIFIIFGCIINPIRENNKLKEENKNK